MLWRVGGGFTSGFEKRFSVIDPKVQARARLRELNQEQGEFIEKFAANLLRLEAEIDDLSQVEKWECFFRGVIPRWRGVLLTNWIDTLEEAIPFIAGQEMVHRMTAGRDDKSST